MRIVRLLLAAAKELFVSGRWYSRGLVALGQIAAAVFGVSGAVPGWKSAVSWAGLEDVPNWIFWLAVGLLPAIYLALRVAHLTMPNITVVGVDTYAEEDSIRVRVLIRNDGPSTKGLLVRWIGIDKTYFGMNDPNLDFDYVLLSQQRTRKGVDDSARFDLTSGDTKRVEVLTYWEFTSEIHVYHETGELELESGDWRLDFQVVSDSSVKRFSIKFFRYLGGLLPLLLRDEIDAWVVESMGRELLPTP